MTSPPGPGPDPGPDPGLGPDTDPGLDPAAAGDPSDRPAEPTHYRGWGGRPLQPLPHVGHPRGQTGQQADRTIVFLTPGTRVT